ncbi:DUF429 domain-containing protein [Mucisphaera calidilacus]|uniref:DUF429 domain-containing protein n=1 Tax=Mucisphaera calidilacus TaxID=2527982 RepID=A0A518BZW1_9BACT|nr:DUF429 domain-containing protein [Mucisphaera calidilacus]QDU72505.1 hypothetical protein Pan265_23710 [Mucisphaera calidilacus]
MLNSILGIDFSAARDAGRRIWITRAHINDDALRILEVSDLASLLSVTPSPDDCLPALVDSLCQQPPAIIGIDAPLSVPLRFMPDGYERFVRDCDLTADQLREQIRDEKRKCDTEASTPFAPGNLRMYRQTHAVITRVIRPLVKRHAASVQPMMDASHDQHVLIEACPASSLRTAGRVGELELRPYKGRSAEHRKQRAVILDWLMTKRVLDVPDRLRRRLLDNSGGDALDSLICAVITACARRDLNSPCADHHEREGRVFFKLD